VGSIGTILRPREHYTDTHGFTEQLFGLCHLLGFSFMPRLKDLKDQQLYRPDREPLGILGSIMDAAVDTALIREQWDQLVRVAASLKNRTAPAHLVLERLAGSPRSDRLAKALTALRPQGRPSASRRSRAAATRSLMARRSILAAQAITARTGFE